LRAAAILT